ncbi:unnamed protein product [Miscanthus lutarioriparius]|uniref:Uncharacterized protein n=1 Tax=Miscanthus lutarioriparius TaxID=422564 RepID=A0A811Q988_9POAL|nr:unnamed protein product [Miscanthus lutarioriparius]
MLNKAAVIDAGKNQLTGPIPSSFSCLSRVEQLNHAGNCLYGRVPDTLCRLAGQAGHLGNLTLRGNYFTSVGPACTALIKDRVLDVNNNCIPGFANQRRPAECVAFQSQPKKCPEVSTQVSWPAAASTNAAAPVERKARDYHSFLTRFDELSMKPTKLDLRLTDIERQRCPELQENTTAELEKDTMRVMEDAGHAFLKWM